MFELGRGRAPKLEDFGDVFYPDKADEPILARSVRSALMEWLTEIWSEAELAEVGLGPRRRALFDGPPGVGKTTLAHHLAARLGILMVAVRPDRLIDKYVGSTGQNIGALFDAAAASGEPTLLFLDEFDALGLKRRSGTNNGAEDERNNYINTLLQRLEQHKGFIVAATNFGGNVDPAVWRRFDIQIRLELPGQAERERILARYLSPYDVPQSTLVLLGEAFAGAAPSLMRQFCEGLKRQLVLGPKVGWDMDRAAVIGRLLASNAPHPDLERPRLWNRGASDPSVAAIPWPLVLQSAASKAA